MAQVHKTSLSSVAGLAWAAAWRAQAAHLLFFAVVPQAVAAGESAIKIVFLPFLLLSFGDRSIELTTAVDHLTRPGCWVALAPCEVANTALVRLRAEPVGGKQPSTQSDADDDLAAVDIPDFLTWRHVWFAAWLGWFLVYLVRRERKARPPET